MGYKHYGVNTGGIPLEYIKRYLGKHEIPIFIETGTAGGDSVRAVAPLFKKCHTIEIIEGRPTGGFPENVQSHIGDSSKLLNEIASRYPRQNIFFWLDAHWSEPFESPEGTDECPILKEIAAIKHVGNRALIMIDDARLFYSWPPHPNNPAKWPRLQFVFESLRMNFPNHVTTIVDDYIICLPMSMEEVHHTEWRENFDKRYPSDADKLKLAAQDLHEAFINYIRPEGFNSRKHSIDESFLNLIK